MARFTYYIPTSRSNELQVQALKIGKEEGPDLYLFALAVEAGGENETNRPCLSFLLRDVDHNMTEPVALGKLTDDPDMSIDDFRPQFSVLFFLHTLPNEGKQYFVEGLEFDRRGRRAHRDVSRPFLIAGPSSKGPTVGLSKPDPLEILAPTVVFPSGGSVPNGPIAAYGTIGLNDNLADEVVLYYGATEKHRVSNPYYSKPLNFWSATFTGVEPGNNRKVKVFGNASDGEGGFFTVNN